MVVPPEEDDYTWVMVVVVLMALGGGAAILLMMKKKNNQGAHAARESDYGDDQPLNSGGGANAAYDTPPPLPALNFPAADPIATTAGTRTRQAAHHSGSTRVGMGTGLSVGGSMAVRTAAAGARHAARRRWRGATRRRGGMSLS